MTQIPPPPSSPINYGRPQQQPTNALAIVSLVCGILGCFVITPVIAIVTGIIALGKARMQGGRGLAITGIVLGALWCLGAVGLSVGGFALYKNASAIITQAAEPQTIALINRLGSGNVSRDPSVANLSDQQLQDISTTAARLGTCQDIDINSTSMTRNNGLVTVEFSGTAKFDNGQAAIDARMRVGGSAGSNVMEYEKLELK